MNYRNYFFHSVILIYLLLPQSVYSNNTIEDAYQFIKIDQFGYLPEATKIAVISNPVVGFYSGTAITPSQTYELKEAITDSTVFENNLEKWMNGNVHEQSGDVVWYFNFTDFKKPGKYYVYDPINDIKSFDFKIENNVYLDALREALRVFYYQRCGIPKVTPFADERWSDSDACHVGFNQDKNALNYSVAGFETKPSKDVSGGWHDAGDHNKYVTYAWEPLLNLLMTYLDNPTFWNSFNLNIPESDNNLADILDEAKVGLDWILKMQSNNIDGSVNCVTGTSSWRANRGLPSIDSHTRFYSPATTHSTTSAAACFALGAYVFNKIGQYEYSNRLLDAAERAWSWIESNPRIFWNNSGKVGAGNADGSWEWNSKIKKMSAACYLFAVTGSQSYNDYIIQRVYDVGTSGVETTAKEAMLFYANLPNADQRTKQIIHNVITRDLGNFASVLTDDITSSTDAYRAHISSYDWGSNLRKAQTGTLFQSVERYNLPITKHTLDNYKNTAMGYVHYFHGVNPLFLTYLTNMSVWGAEKSLTTIYHTWFNDDIPKWDEVSETTYGPPPGYITVGANQNYTGDNSIIKLQPPQKAYYQFNTNGNSAISWEITEPQVRIQASYIRMLSHYCYDGPTGKEVWLQGDNNLFVGFDEITEKMYCNADTASKTNVRYLVEFVGGNKVALKGENHKYITINEVDGSVNIGQTDIVSASKFTWILNPDGSLSLKGENNKFLGYDSEKSNELTCSSSTISNIEKFNYNFFDKNKIQTNIEEITIDNNMFKIYPNPIKDDFNVEIHASLLEANLYFYVYDINGKLLIKKNITDEKSTFSYNKLPKGVYLTQIRMSDKVLSKKILKL